MTTTHETAPVAHSHDHGHGGSGHGDHQHSGAQHGAGVEKSERENAKQLGAGAPMLDIGGDIGALVLYTAPELEGLEIEVSLTSDLGTRTHTEVLRRTVNGNTFWAGVYAHLPEGDYRMWYDDPERETSFTITGGSVSELDWS